MGGGGEVRQERLYSRLTCARLVLSPLSASSSNGQVLHLVWGSLRALMIRAHSLFLALGALVRPGANFLAHCRNFSRRVKNFRRTASNTWSTYLKRIVTLQKEQLRLRAAIWAYSSSIEHNENKYKNQNISHKS